MGRGLAFCLTAAAAAQPQELSDFGREIAVPGAPRPLAYGPDGRLYLGESQPGAVCVVSADEASAERFGIGLLHDPQGLCVSDQGTVFVADAEGILVFGADGALLRRLGQAGRGPGQLLRPAGLVLRGEQVCVADSGNDRVQILDRDGRAVGVIGERGRGPGQFRRPLGLAADPEGSLYVSDADNHRLQKFDAAGRHVQTWGDFGAFPGLFNEPGGLAFAEGRLFVCDRLNHRVQIFGPDGRFAASFGGHAVLPREGRGMMHYPYAVAVAAGGQKAAVSEPLERRCQIFVPRGSGVGGPFVPRMPPDLRPGWDFGPLLSLSGDLLAVVEPQGRMVLLYNTARAVPVEIHRFGEVGDRFGQFARVSGVGVDQPRRRVYVSDAANQRVSAFDLAFDPQAPVRQDPGMSRFAKAVEAAPFMEGGGFRPGPLAVAPDGRVMVLDEGGGAIVVLDADLHVVERWDVGTGATGTGGAGTGGAGTGGTGTGGAGTGGAGTGGMGTGGTVAARSIAAGPAGDAVVLVDPLRGAVLVLGPDGAPVRIVGGDGSLLSPAGAMIEADGSVLVADAGTDTIAVFDPAGALVARWGGSGAERGRLWQPAALGRDGRGRLFVLDYGNHRMQIFDRAGEWEVVFGTGRAFTRTRPEPAR
jgi:DNA-binding beta-propeller fold protein YncE